MPDIRKHVIATGHVQGVFLRDSTKKEARSLGIRGWIANLPDGRVEAEFQGDPEAVSALIAFVREGPGYARVTDLAISDIDPLPKDRAFLVR